MVDWVRYAVRLTAAVVLVGLALVFVMAAAMGGKSRLAMLALSLVVGLAGVFAWPRRPHAWRNDKPTDKQLAFARDLGIEIPRRITKGELSDLIDQAKRIRDAF
jgi:hypothetical protein